MVVKTKAKVRVMEKAVAIIGGAKNCPYQSTPLLQYITLPLLHHSILHHTCIFLSLNQIRTHLHHQRYFLPSM